MAVIAIDEMVGEFLVLGREPGVRAGNRLIPGQPGRLGADQEGDHLEAGLGQPVHLLVGDDPFPDVVAPLDVIPREIDQALDAPEPEFPHAPPLKIVVARPAVGPHRGDELGESTGCGLHGASRIGPNDALASDGQQNRSIDRLHGLLRITDDHSQPVRLGFRSITSSSPFPTPAAGVTQVAPIPRG